MHFVTPGKWGCCRFQRVYTGSCNLLLSHQGLSRNGYHRTKVSLWHRAPLARSILGMPGIHGPSDQDSRSRKRVTNDGG